MQSSGLHLSRLRINLLRTMRELQKISGNRITSLKKLMADLKMVYAAPDEAAALEELESFGEK